KLEPGAKELWTALISGPDAARAAAEMVVGMYDASLDQYARHDWMRRFSVFRAERGWRAHSLQTPMMNFWHVRRHWATDHKSAHWSYRSFPPKMLVQHRYRPYPAPMAVRGRGGDEAFALSSFEVQEDASGYQARASLAGTRMEAQMVQGAGSDAMKLDFVAR